MTAAIDVADDAFLDALERAAASYFIAPWDCVAAMPAE